MNDVLQELASLRQHVAELEQRIEALEAEGFDADFDAWVERNKAAINASILEDDEAMARGEYFEGTVDELRARFLAETRGASAAK